VASSLRDDAPAGGRSDRLSGWRVGGLLALLVLCAAVWAEAAEGPEESLATVTYTLRHQAVREAVGLVFPFLSPEGSVEVRPGENELVVTDSARVLERILPALREFDRPGRNLRLALRLVAAAAEATDADYESGLSEDLLERLRELLPFRVYQRVAAVDLEVAEGGGVGAEISSGFRVDFRMGRLQPDRRIKLYGFRISRLDREPEAAPLIHTNVNLRLDKPLVLGLARTEASDTALMVVLRCALEEGGQEEGAG
jgi:hypothetical protein